MRKKIHNLSLTVLLAVTSVGAAIAPLFLYQIANAASTVVTPANPQGWSTADTRPGGAVNFVRDASAPAGAGALQLTTDLTTSSKAQYLHEANTPLANVTELSYYAKQVSGPLFADPSYQLLVDLNGAAAGGFTTFVYEPYENTAQGAVVPNTWQQWDVDQGQFWSSRSFTEDSCVVAAGGGGAPFYTLAALKTMCPNAVAVGFGVNIGSNNPGYNVESDLVSFNGAVYNFEPTLTPSKRSDCKNDGWKQYNTPSFNNQGQCVSFVEKNSREIDGDIKYNAGGLNREAWFSMNTADDRGWFVYSDAKHDWYGVRVTEMKVDGNNGWFAGQVDRSKDGKYNGQWLFAKVVDGKPDQISGSFVNEAAAKAGVEGKQNPADGPFNVQHGNIKIKKV